MEAPAPAQPQGDKPGIKAAKQTPDGTRTPFPDDAWNSWRPGDDAKHAFVHTNAVRIGPDGNVWLVAPARSDQVTLRSRALREFSNSTRMGT